MDSYRANLDQPQNTTSYLVLTSIFLILSAIGLYTLFVYLPNRSKSSAPQLTSEILPTSIPTDFLLPTDIPSTSGVEKPTLKPTISSSPLPSYIDYQSPTDNFSVTYPSSRKLYQDTEFSGRRYTFYQSEGNISVHVGSVWSWTHPDRTFSNNFLVDGHNTFRYDIASQTLVDLQDKSKNYTIQCVHNGLASQKTACDQFIKTFKFLKL